MQKYKDFWKRIVTLITKKDVFHHASAITFNLIICSIPFVLLLVSIIGYILSYETAFAEVLRFGQQVFPSFTYQSTDSDLYQGAITLENLLEPLVSARRVFGIAGIIILIFFSVGLIHTIKHVIFEIFEVSERNHILWEVVHNFFTFGLIGGIFIFFSIAISIFSVITIDSVTLPYTDQVITMSQLYQSLSTIVPLLFTLLIFYILFRYISEKRITRKAAFVGAAVFTILFSIARIGLGIYLDYSLSSYRYYYQGYTLPIIIGFWAFYSAVLLVISAIVAKAFQDTFLKKTLRKNPYTSIS